MFFASVFLFGLSCLFVAGFEFYSYLQTRSFILLCFILTLSFLFIINTFAAIYLATHLSLEFYYFTEIINCFRDLIDEAISIENQFLY